MLQRDVHKSSYILFIVFSASILTRGVLPENTSEILMLCLSFFFLLKYLLKTKMELTINKHTFFIVAWLLIFLLNCLIPLFYHNNFASSIVYLVYFIIGLILYFLLQNMLGSQERTISFLNCFIFLVVIIAIFTIKDHILYISTGQRSQLLYIRGAGARGSGLYLDNPNYYSVSLLMGIGFILGMYHFQLIKSKLLKYIHVFNLVILLTSIFLTLSRGAFISVIFMLILFSIFNYKVIYSPKRLFIGLIIILISTYLVAGNPTIYNQISDQLTSKVDNAINESGSGRYEIWMDGWRLFTSQPTFFLFGVGGNQVKTYHNFGLDQHVHNNYLRFLYENGIIGFVLMIILSLKIFRMIFSIEKLKIQSPFFYIVIGIYVMSLSNDMFIIKEFWIIITLTVLWNVYSTFYKNTSDSKMIL